MSNDLAIYMQNKVQSIYIRHVRTSDVLLYAADIDTTLVTTVTTSTAECVR